MTKISDDTSRPRQYGIEKVTLWPLLGDTSCPPEEFWGQHHYWCRDGLVYCSDNCRTLSVLFADEKALIAAGYERLKDDQDFG